MALDFYELKKQAKALVDGAQTDTHAILEGMAADFRRAKAQPRESSQTLRVLFASLAIFAAFLPIAFWFHHSYVLPPRPEGKVVELILNRKPIGGFAYEARSFAFVEQAGVKSPAILYEDMTPLGPGYSPIEEIKQKGAGRYAHVKLPDRPTSWTHLIFSTSDNSDPNTNGRSYYLVLPHEPK